MKKLEADKLNVLAVPLRNTSGLDLLKLAILDNIKGFMIMNF